MVKMFVSGDANACCCCVETGLDGTLRNLRTLNKSAPKVLFHLMDPSFVEETGRFRTGEFII